MSPKLCKAESEASHLQISKERILSRSENIFKGSISVTEHQGQKWEIWAKAKPEIISDVPSHPFTKGLQLESPQVPLSLSPSLPSSLGMSLRCRSQASSSRDHSRSESGPHQALPSGCVRQGVEGGAATRQQMPREDYAGKGAQGKEQEASQRKKQPNCIWKNEQALPGGGTKWPLDEGAGG